MFKEFITKIFSSSADVDIVDDKNRFNVIYQKMLNTRWYITILTILTLMVILLGIALCVVFSAHIAQEWKEILLLLLGAFIGSYNRVIDYWFNNSQRDDKLIEKIDQENDSNDLVKAKLAMMSRKGNGDEVVNDPPLEMPSLDKMGFGKKPDAPAPAPSAPPPPAPSAPAAPEAAVVAPEAAPQAAAEASAPAEPTVAEAEAPKGEGEAAPQGEVPQG